jgi:ribosomal-protein-alanine N-acetyltransferase
MVNMTNLPNIKIEHMSSYHLDDVLEIEPIAFGKHHWSRESFNNEINNLYSCYLVICIENKTIGYIGAWQIQDEGHITTLAVHPEYRRKHIADILLYSLFKEFKAKKVKWLTLEVRISNIAAVNLYKKFHFKQLGVRKKYYQDNNEDGLILWSQDIQSKETEANFTQIYAKTFEKETV